MYRRIRNFYGQSTANATIVEVVKRPTIIFMKATYIVGYSCSFWG